MTAPKSVPAASPVVGHSAPGANLPAPGATNARRDPGSDHDTAIRQAGGLVALGWNGTNALLVPRPSDPNYLDAATAA